MSKAQKVVWTKGMFLMPQHFQAQDRYFEQTLHFRAGVSNFANWGLSRMAVDEASLVNGLFTLRYCEGIMPDGLIFQAPLVDEVPAGRQIEDHFSAARQPHLDVYLAVPEERESARNFGMITGETAAKGNYRYVAETIVGLDETVGDDEKAIQVAKKLLRILFDGENLDGFTSFRIARVERSAAGTFVLKADFMPPMIDIAASEALMTLARRLVEILAAKSASLSTTRRQRGPDLADFSNSEAADFWFLHTVNTYQPELNHLWKVRRGHPEILFRTMLRLAGALTTFALNENVRDLPEYDHANLGASFTVLDERIRGLLEIGWRSKCEAMPLRPTDRFIWSGSFADERQLDAAQFLLSVSSPIPVDELISKFPRLAKVSSPSELTRLIQASLPGLSLRHQPSPPPSVRLNLSCHYFSLDASGPLWESIRQSRVISVFVPGEITEPKLELLMVQS
jgi:type VI secretion system protein ImpJ